MIPGWLLRIERVAWLQTWWRRLHPDPFGLIVGALFFTLALTPSLLPRDVMAQGIICGLCAATGYLLGVFARWNWHAWMREGLAPAVRKSGVLPPKAWRMRIEGVLMALAVAWMVSSVLFAVRWQREVAELTQARAFSAGEYLGVFPIGLVLWMVLVYLGRLVLAAVDLLTDRAPHSWALGFRAIVAWLALAVVVVVITEQVVPGAVRQVAERAFAPANDTIREDLVAPTNPERSGSPASLNDWEGLGAYGTRFVGLGLHREELEELTGRPAKEPIRVYSGLRHGDTDAERAARVVEELERTGAAERRVLMVATTTGTGWVNPTSAQALELLFDGDTAIAAAQYSYLPSGFQFVAGTDIVREAGKELVSAVVNWWHTLPEDHRPKLLVYGESLGVMAGDAAFSGLRDITESVDGILWLGPPNASELWRSFVAGRAPRSREVDPEFAAGMVVRFAQDQDEITQYLTDPTWGETRVLYFQHPSDPVVWWSPDLIFREPDWLKEEPGFDRSPSMRWLPFITFFQLTSDLPVAANVPNGHGHNYGTGTLDGLAAISGEGFTPEFVEQVRGELETAMLGQGPEKEIGVKPQTE